MNLFLVKKAFFDMWDNLLAVFLINIGFVLVVAAALYLPFLLNFVPALSYLGVAVGIGLGRVIIVRAVVERVVKAVGVGIGTIIGYVTMCNFP